jgi:hypothetical protein
MKPQLPKPPKQQETDDTATYKVTFRMDRLPENEKGEWTGYCLSCDLDISKLRRKGKECDRKVKCEAKGDCKVLSTVPN